MSDSLKELQKEFLAAMMGSDSAMVRGRLSMQAAGVSPETGLSIYRNAYSARLREALDNDHPALGNYLGDLLWNKMCDGYISMHPSKVRSLRNFGNALPVYLRNTEPFSANPHIAELCELERCLLDSFDAADAGRADWSQLLETPEAQWPTLKVRFHPSLQRHYQKWNCVEMWRALKDQQTPPNVSVASTTDWIIWRDRNHVTSFRSMNEEESSALSFFLEGGDFAGVCEHLLAWRDTPLVPAAALSLLHTWCHEGLVSRWQIDESLPELSPV